MTDNHFPSGPWTGFFNYTGPEDRHRMDLSLKFENGRVTGEGSDCVGMFAIEGAYDGSSHECQWRKRYVGAHTVHYRGFAEAIGIWGQWEIGRFFKGGFHIWPRAEGVDSQESLAAEAPLGIGSPEPDKHAVQPAIPGFEPKP